MSGITKVRSAAGAAFGAIILAALAAACTPSGRAPPTVAAAPGSGATAPGLALPEGGGCAGEIARYRAVVANDLATGHVNRGVHDRIGAEIDRASAACAAGREAEAQRQIRATKARFGYS